MRLFRLWHGVQADAVTVCKSVWSGRKLHGLTEYFRSERMKNTSGQKWISSVLAVVLIGSFGGVCAVGGVPKRGKQRRL